MKSLDFNSVNQPTMQITLPNEERTRLTLTVPKTSVIERLSANAGDVSEILQSKDIHAIMEFYKILADIFSSNQQFRKFTAEELKECLTIYHVEAFLVPYMEFISEMKFSKN